MIRKHNYLNIVFWIFILVIPFLLQTVGVINTTDWMIDQSNGLISIITGSFLHGNFKHLVGNLTGILLGVSLLYNLYRKHYWKVITLGVIIPSGLMYLLGLPCVGISGLVYALIWYIITRGLMSIDRTRFLIAITVLLFYGGSLAGAIPLDAFSRIAWQCHLAGVLTGLGLALYQRLKG